MLSSPRLFALVVLLSLTAGCGKSKTIEAGETCTLNTDCNSPLVCTMNKCHEGCRVSRDCPLGQSCVMVSGVGVCQLPAESQCNANLPCGPLLICASDLRCRANCSSAANCAEEQVCVDSVCADGSELVNGKLPVSSDPTVGPFSQPDGGSPDTGSAKPDLGSTGYTLGSGSHCYTITAIAPGTYDGCLRGVEDMVGLALPGSYDSTQGLFTLGSQGYFGSGTIVNGSGTLRRSGKITDVSVPGCTWSQTDTTSFTLTGNDRFMASVVENMDTFALACGADYGTCASTWTWTMELDSTLTAPGCTKGSTPSATVLTVNPHSIDLGAVDIGTKSAPVTITVTNAGTTTSGPLTVSVSGAGIAASGCAGTTLAPKATCTIAVTAQPAAAGPITGTVAVGDNPTSTKTVSVVGNVVMTGLFSLAPSPLDLGAVALGKPTSGIVVLTNTATAAMTGITIAVNGTGFSAGSGTCTDTLTAGSNCTVVVNFTGTTSGVAKGSVTVSQGGVTKSVVVTATVQAAAKLVLTPTSASFQTVVGTPSAPVTFLVGNSGDVNSTIPTVSITGTNKDDFSFTSTCGMALFALAANSCQIVVVYTPKVVPTTNSVATLTVSESGTGGSSVSASLTGTAVAPGALVITGAATDLGMVVIGDSGTALTFTVANTGGVSSGALRLSTDKSQFTFANDNCSDMNLESKKTCLFTVQFKPSASDVGVVAGQIKATAANVQNPSFLGITGTAVPQAKLTMKPVALDFGAVTVLQESAPLTLTVSNAGGAPTGVLKVENTGAQFSVKGDTCTGATLAPSGTTNSCVVIVTFIATTTSMDATGSVVVTDTTGAAGAASATMHGSGIAAPSLGLSPATVCPQSDADDSLCVPSASTNRFNNVGVGQSTPEMTFTVSNLTSPADAPDSGVLTFNFLGNAPSDFVVVSNTCTTPLVSSANVEHPSCTVTVSFSPTATGLRKAIFRVITSRGGSAQATLEGKGLG